MPIRRQAVFLPGRNYSIQGPLFMYTHIALRSRGVSVYPLEWREPDYLNSDPQMRIEGVSEQLQAMLEKIDYISAPPLLVGKSIGSAGAALAARFSLPAVWFSPLLNDYPIVQSLRRSSAPYLLVGGTEDPAWVSSLADELPGDVCEIPGGDHGLFLPGRPLTSSVFAMADIIEAVEHFLDTKVWRRGA
ncbi:alpha/beta fold hydrolase [Salininema proteolyticum]|uniref:Alpha/beta hydrolase n=1 Tax=Salininema proteolyticum TaxID=1607685 RepID=A0ABV8U5T9_9ACTN